MDKQIIISIKTILLTLLILLGAYVLYKLGPIIGIFLVSLVIVISLEPAVRFFRKITLLNKPLSRAVAVIATYLIVVALLALILTIGLPPVLIQAQKLFASLSQLPQGEFFAKLGISISDIVPKPSVVSGNLLSITLSVFSNVAVVVSILIISLYMSLDWENIKRSFVLLFPIDTQDKVLDIVNHVELVLGSWVKGEFILMLAVGVTSFVGLLALGINYPLALGLFSGIFEIIPAMGPLVSAVFAAIVGFAESPVKGFMVVALFLIIQQLENNLLVPKIMQKVSGFRPIIIIFALLIGSRFFGVGGAIMAVPVMMIGVIIFKKIFNFPSREY